jgi:hypothetical protein
MSGRRRLTAAIASLLLVAGMGAAPSTAASSAGTVYVSTVPAVPGLAIDIGGVVQTTGPDGSAVAAVSNINGMPSRVRLAGTTTPAGDPVRLTRVVLGRHVPHESHLTLGLEISSLVRLRLGAGTSGVAPQSVHRLRLHSVAGEIRDLDPQKVRSVTLLARRAMFQHGVLTAQRVTWSVDRIAVVPGVAVTTAHAAFDPLRHRTWRLSLEPVHGDVVIRTVPAVAGAVFSLDGATIATDARGRAKAPVDDLNDVSDRIRLASQEAAGGLQVSNMRVSKLPPLVVHQRRVLVAFDVRRPIVFRFIDLAGHSVPSARISDLTMSSGSTTVRYLGPELGVPMPLLTRQASKIGSAWQTRPITYTLRSVRIEGGEAVFNGRQTFVPSSSGEWRITLAVFTLVVTAHDAFFGNQLASRLEFTRPDGSRLPLHLSSNSGRRTPSLVRGLYSVQIDSAVLAGRASVLVSRNEAIDLRVVTLWDAVVFLLVVLLIVVGAVFGGRRMARRRERARSLR